VKKTVKRLRCPICRTRFAPVVDWQKYDRDACRIAAHYLRQKEIIAKAKQIVREQAGL